MHSRQTYFRCMVGAAFAMAATGWNVMPAAALECPQSQSKTMRGALKETPKQISADARMLAARGWAAIPGLVHSIREANPASSDGEVTNYLITAYCPVVNDRQLSEGQKKADLARFASQVRRRLQ